MGDKKKINDEELFAGLLDHMEAEYGARPKASDIEDEEDYEESDLELKEEDEELLTDDSDEINETDEAESEAVLEEPEESAEAFDKEPVEAPEEEAAQDEGVRDEDIQDEDDDEIRILPEDEEDPLISEAEELLEKHRKKKKRRKILLIVLLILAIAYGGASAFFMGHFYPNTTINGTAFSLRSVSQVQNHMEQEVENYVLSMKESDGGTETIDGKDISLKYVRDDSLNKLIEKQNPFLWITGLWKKQEIEASIGVEYNKASLAAVIDGLDCMADENQIPSESAKPEFTGEKFEITPEKIGTALNKEVFADTVLKAINGFQKEIDLVEEGCYILPKFTEDSPEVAEAMDEMNSELGAEITLDLNPYTEVVDSAVIAQWITVDDNMQVTFNQDAVRTYVAELAEKYDTYGKPRTFVTGSGNTVQVEGGSYGWLLDQEAEYNALIANIQNAEVVTREPNYSRRGATHEANDYGRTYAEVDLSAQHMYYFKDGQMVMQCDVVTGNPNKGNATPQGVYSLAYKARDQVLRGKKKEDGTYEYESPVSYWMPFNGGIGFHDANWQSAFGGTRYQVYGSHGCINMPPASAGELYNYIEAGVPVICHY